MKKVFCVLFVIAIVVLGVLGALAVLPHAHGHDFHHSQHENCPVYQFSISHSNAMQAGTVFFAFFGLSFFLLILLLTSFSKPFNYFFSLRAPPCFS